MCVDDPEVKGLPMTGDSYELYIVKCWKVQALCSTLSSTSMFNNCLTQLYMSVKESCNHPKLDSDIMAEIEAFMGGATASTIDDDELPFLPLTITLYPSRMTICQQEGDK